MFYDERIEKVKGNIIKNALLIAAVLFAVFGLSQALNVSINTNSILHFSYAATELAISALCFVCLIIGAIKGKASVKDERTASEKSNFYNRAVLPLIIAAGVIYALLFAVTSCLKVPNGFFYIPSYMSIRTVLFVVGVYVICGLRRNDIFFNYSIMEEEHYYKCVFKNIGKFFLYILCLIVVSTLTHLTLYALDIYYQMPTKIILQTADRYLVSFIIFSVLYLLYSFFEKMSCENEMFISNSSVFSLAVTIFLYVIFTQFIVTVDILPISQALKLQRTQTFSMMKIYLQFALIMFLAYFNYEYKKVKRNDALSVACGMIISSEVYLFLSSAFMNSVMYIAMPSIMDINSANAFTIGQIVQFFSYCNLFIENGAYLLKLAGFGIFALAMVNDKLISKANILALPLFIVIFIVKMFLRTQIGVLGVNIYSFITETLILIYFCIIVALVKGKVKKLCESESLPC